MTFSDDGLSQHVDRDLRDLAAERVVLSVWLSGIYADTLPPLPPVDLFALDAHVELYRVIERRLAAGEPCDHLALTIGESAAWWEQMHGKVPGGGHLTAAHDYLAQITSGDRLPSLGSLDYYLRLLENLATRRAVVRAAVQAVHAARQGADDYAAVAAGVGSAARVLFAQQRDAPELRCGAELAAAAAQRERERAASSDADCLLPWPSWREALQLARGRVALIGARTGAGKTTLGLNVLAEAVRRSHRVMVFTGEVDGLDYLEDLVAVLSGVATADAARFGPGHAEYRGWYDYLIDNRMVTFAEHAAMRLDRMITHMGEAARGTEPPGLVLLDHMGLVLAAPGARAADRHDLLGDAADALKATARANKQRLVILNQINRAGSDEPEIQHLSGSDRVAQAVDLVLLAHRPNLGCEVDPSQPDYTTLRCRKKRVRGPIPPPLTLDVDSMTGVAREVTDRYERPAPKPSRKRRD